tara:strand:+ start:802 stop:1008 length:207 start_codon:yes stop_codon:yes gene_type:complete
MNYQNFVNQMNQFAAAVVEADRKVFRACVTPGADQQAAKRERAKAETAMETFVQQHNVQCCTVYHAPR